jgi:hypothetical protein
VVCFVEDRPGLVQQAFWLRRSWVLAASADTDLVMFGPPDALDQLPDDVVKIVQRPVAISADRGLTYLGVRNVGWTWYGRTRLVREASALAETLTLQILEEHFASGPGVWPCWYRGVASMYSGEIAVNHRAPEAIKSDLLDVASTSPLPIEHVPHIHCWHAREKFPTIT